MLSMCLGFGEGREVGLIWVSEADKWKGSVANEQTIASVEQGFPSEPTQQQSVRRRWRWTRRSPYPIGSCLGECRRLTGNRVFTPYCSSRLSRLSLACSMQGYPRLGSLLFGLCGTHTGPGRLPTLQRSSCGVTRDKAPKVSCNAESNRRVCRPPHHRSVFFWWPLVRY